MPSFLLVDDDEAHAELLRRALSDDGFSGIDVACDGEQALILSSGTHYNVIILELEIPKIDGFTVLRRLRERGVSAPILVLSRRAAVADRVQALWVGADDYLCKPFDLEELQARLRALSRRAAAQALKLRVADLEMDMLQRSVRRAGRRIDLCKKGFAILEYLMRNVDSPVTRNKLLDHVWGGKFKGLTNIVDVYINYLRRKIDQDFAIQLIHTVRGTGYMISASFPHRESRQAVRAVHLEEGDYCN